MLTGRLEEFLKMHKEKFFSKSGENVKLNLMKISSRPGKYSSVLFYLFIGIEDSPRYFLKINRKPGYFTAIENEYANLKYLDEKLAGFDFSIPRPVFCEKFDGNIIMCENFLEGERQLLRFKKLEGKNFRAVWEYLSYYLELSSQWLINFQKNTVTGGIVVDDSWMKNEFFGNAADYIKSNPCIEDSIKNKFLDISGRITKFKGIRLPVVSSQGDFDQWNVLIDNGRIAVVDWEDFTCGDIPYPDFYTLFFNLALLYNLSRGESDNFEKFFRLDSPMYAVFRKILSLFSRKHDLPQELFFILAPVYAVKTIVKKYPVHRDPLSIPINSLNSLKLITNLCWREINNEQR